MIDTLAVLLVERARTGALGAVLPQHSVLRRRELAPPLLLAHCDCEFLGRRMISAAEAAQQALCHDARLSDRSETEPHIGTPMPAVKRQATRRLHKSARARSPVRRELSALARPCRGRGATIPPSSGRSSTKPHRSARRRRSAAAAPPAAQFPRP